MIDTSGIISPFLVFDYNISTSSAQSIAPLYSFVWGASIGNAPHWRTGNASIETSYYFPSYRDNGTFNGQGSDYQTLSWWQSNHPNWIIYKSDGVTPAYFGDGSARVPLNIQDADVIAWQVSQYVVPTASNGSYTYMAADNVDLNNNQGAYGYYPNATTGNAFAAPFTQLYSGSANDTTYSNAVASWCQSFASQVHTHGLKLVPNVSFGSRDFKDASVLNITSSCDAILDEGGFANYGAGNISGSSWVNRICYMQYVQSLGKPYFVINILPDSNNSSIEFALASYLMAKGSSMSIFITPLGSGFGVYGQEEWYTQYNTAMGTALSVCSSPVANIWERLYTNGRALCKTGTSGQTNLYNLPDGTYTSLFSGTQQTQIDFTTISALVLTPSYSVWSTIKQ